MKYILGKKIGMLQVFDVTGKVFPATVIHCEPNKVIYEKTDNNNVVVGFDSIESKKNNKAKQGIFKKHNCETNYNVLYEIEKSGNLKAGSEINVSQFKPGEYVDVQGLTKGRGFTGAIKRWNFKIGPLSHGAGWPHRYQGSIAMGRGGSQAQRVKKGQKMSGHYGHEKVTIQNLLVLFVNNEDHTITIMGAVPGPNGSVVSVKNSDKNKKSIVAPVLITQQNLEAVKTANEKLSDKEALHKINEVIDKAESAQQKNQPASEKKDK